MWTDRDRMRLEEPYGWANNTHYQGYRSIERCLDFTKGRCFRGGACRYTHHVASFEVEWSVRDESRLERHSGLPCKYFLRGRCIHGEGCKFSHLVVEPSTHVQRSLDGSQHGFVSGGSAGNITAANASELQDQTPYFGATNSTEKVQRRIPKWDAVAELHDENVGDEISMLGKFDDACTDLTEVATIIPILSMNVDGSEFSQFANQSREERNNKIIHSDYIPEKTQYSDQFDLKGGCKDGFKKQALDFTSQDRTMAEYVENQDKSHKVACDVSPCHEESYHRTCNMPLVDERSRPHRSRSRSRSKSTSRSRSRSKNPSCVSMWTDRGRMRVEEHYGWANNAHHQGYLSIERCFDFTKGRCFRGAACRYTHHASSFDGEWSVRDESRLERRSGLPCKYFSRGRCFHDEGCKFSHQVIEPVNTFLQHGFVSGGSAGNITSANASELQDQTPHFAATID